LRPPLGGNSLEFWDETYPRKTRGMGLLYGENSVILASTVFDWSTRVTDRQTDGIAIAYTRYMLSRVKTAKLRITQTTPHDSPGTKLSFLLPKILAKIERGHPQQGRHVQVGWVKIGDIQQITGYNLKTIQYSCIVSIEVEKESYVLYRMVCCRWPWVTIKFPKLLQFLHFALPFVSSYLVNAETSNLVDR